MDVTNKSLQSAQADITELKAKVNSLSEMNANLEERVLHLQNEQLGISAHLSGSVQVSGKKINTLS